MDSGEFTQRYELQDAPDASDIALLDSDIEAITDVHELYASSRAWSDVFSNLLHNALAEEGVPTVEEFKQIATSYQGWVFGTLPKINKQLQTILRTSEPSEELAEQARKERQHATFHDVNVAFTDMWAKLFGIMPDKDLNTICREISFSLAMKGCQNSLHRQGVEDARGESEYFKDEYSNGRKLLESMLGTMDTGIVLLEIARKKKNGFLVLPSPSAFEYKAGGDESTTNANTDYVIVEPERNRAVGVQSRARIGETALRGYDPDRVVSVDGQIDLGSQAAKRTKAHSSTKHVVGWAGLLAAETMNGIKPNSPFGRHLIANGLMGLKAHARKSTQGFKPQIQQAVANIEPRIIKSL